MRNKQAPAFGNIKMRAHDCLATPDAPTPLWLRPWLCCSIGSRHQFAIALAAHLQCGARNPRDGPKARAHRRDPHASGRGVFSSFGHSLSPGRPRLRLAALDRWCRRDRWAPVGARSEHASTPLAPGHTKWIPHRICLLCAPGRPASCDCGRRAHGSWRAVPQSAAWTAPARRRLYALGICARPTPKTSACMLAPSASRGP
mmetsp:Transcript_109573/g.214769  ORF Transcript_109573/g.214769 Transcript_109573/m.214769 type:complete len:201 (+) Transcript_109573:191-793(+)